MAAMAHDGQATVEQRPNKLARILAATIVSSLTALIVTKLFGRKAGILAVFVTASMHEVMEAPLARVLGERFDLMTS